MTEPMQVRRDTFIAAPPAAVFAYLTDPEKLVGWMGSQAATEPRAGGIYLIQNVGRQARNARGSFREVVPVHRLAYAFGWDDDPDVPPGSTLVELDLIDQDGGTLLRITHSGLPNARERDGHARGWAHYLGRLAVIAAGGDPGPDPGVGARMA